MQARSPASWPRASAIGLGLLAVLLYGFWSLRIVSTGHAGGLDGFEFFYPTYAWVADQIRDGAFPLWNPYQLTGRPTLAALQGGMLYPPHLIYLVLPIHVGMAISSYGHLLLAGGATFFFATRLGLRTPACLLAAILFSMRGGLPSYAVNPAMLESIAWLAPGCLAVLEIARGCPRRGSLGLAAVTALSLLAGFPQHTLYAAYTWLFLALSLSLIDRAPVRLVATHVALCAAAIALGALIAGAQLLPALELSAESVRPRGSLTLHEMFPFGLARDAGVLEALLRAFESRGAVPGLALSFGIVGLVLLPLALFGRRHRMLVAVFAGLGLLTLAFAAGPESPLFSLYLALPELASFRIPDRVLVVTDLCFALLAAMGLQTIINHVEGIASRRTSAGAVFVHNLPWLLAACVILLATLEIFGGEPNQTRLPYDVEHPRLRPFHDPPPAIAGLAGEGDRAWVLAPHDSRQWPWKAAGPARVRSIADYGVLFSRRQAEYVNYLLWGRIKGVRETPHGRVEQPLYGRTRIFGPQVKTAEVLGRARLAELAAVRHLVVARDRVNRPPLAEYLGVPQIRRTGFRDEHFEIFENERALPRVILTHTVSSAPMASELLARLSAPDFDPRIVSYIDGKVPASLAGPAPRSAPTIALANLGEPTDPSGREESVRIVSDGLHRVTIAAEVTSPALLVLADAWFVGWQATVDGEPATIHPANHLFRGVLLEDPGPHEVVFSYRPMSFKMGLAISSLGLLLWSGLVVQWPGALFSTRREPRADPR